jgi:hypothetical protein
VWFVVVLLLLLALTGLADLSIYWPFHDQTTADFARLLAIKWGVTEYWLVHVLLLVIYCFLARAIARARAIASRAARKVTKMPVFPGCTVF